MLVPAETFSALLQTLGLTQGLYKPAGFSGESFGNGVNALNSSSSVATLPSPFPSSSSISDLANLDPFSDTAPLALESATTENSDDESSCSVDPYNAPVGDIVFPPFDQAKANIFRYRQQQSVNLGSWFVHESWMTPSIFKCASGPKSSEVDIASGYGSTENARAVLERHWDTFINQTDFDYLTSIGINTVRLPIGYWTLGPDYCHDTPFAAVADVYQHSWPRVVRAINMAGEAGIGVLVDLHGAVGSQNGQPHSGISDGTTNLFNDAANMDKTMGVLTFLMQQLAFVTNVVGIELLNEPQNVPELTSFYSRAISTMRQSTPNATIPFYLHDAFDLEGLSTFLANQTGLIVQDHHSYFVYTPSDASEPANQHTKDVSSSVASSLGEVSSRQHRNLVVDEWSCALTSQSLSQEADPDGARRDFCEGQMQVYANTTAGWSFWSYNKEDCESDPGWCFKAAVNDSLPSEFFSYGRRPPTDSAQAQSLATSIASMAPDSPELFCNITLSSMVSTMTVPPLPLATGTASTTWPGTSDASPPARLYKQLTRHEHRLASIHYRRQISPSDIDKRDETTDLTPNQQLAAKGYSDGFLTAKIFAENDMSKLGFMGQYISDSIAACGPTMIGPDTEACYHDGFIKGLQDGEALVSAAMEQ